MLRLARATRLERHTKRVRLLPLVPVPLLTGQGRQGLLTGIAPCRAHTPTILLLNTVSTQEKKGGASTIKTATVAA